MRLATAIKYDLRLQFRHGFYYAYLIVSLAYIAVIRSIPAHQFIRPFLVVSLMTDPSILGFFFLGGIIFLEKGQNILEGLFITPIRMGEYMWSKVISLTILAVLSSLLITVGSIGFSFNLVWFLLGIGLTSVLFVLLGFTLASITTTINGYILTSPIYATATVLPFLDYFNIIKSPLFFLVPTQSTLVLLDGAFNTRPLWELLLATGLLLVFVYLAWLWASHWFYKNIVLRTGAAQ